MAFPGGQCKIICQKVDYTRKGKINQGFLARHQLFILCRMSKSSPHQSRRSWGEQWYAASCLQSHKAGFLQATFQWLRHRSLHSKQVDMFAASSLDIGAADINVSSSHKAYAYSFCKSTAQAACLSHHQAAALGLKTCLEETMTA